MVGKRLYFIDFSSVPDHTLIIAPFPRLLPRPHLNRENLFQTWNGVSWCGKCNTQPFQLVFLHLCSIHSFANSTNKISRKNVSASGANASDIVRQKHFQIKLDSVREIVLPLHISMPKQTLALP